MLFDSVINSFTLLYNFNLNKILVIHLFLYDWSTVLNYFFFLSNYIILYYINNCVSTSIQININYFSLQKSSMKKKTISFEAKLIKM